jgi:PadR family transcriptional regulator PadR
MPKNEMPSGALVMLILRVLRSGSLHGYAIAQRIHLLSSEVLAVEEGSLYPALQKMLLKGWVTAEWGISETNRKVRFYRLTAAGRRQLETEVESYERVTEAIQTILRTA